MSVFGVTLKETAHDITVRDSNRRPLTIPPEVVDHIDMFTNEGEAELFFDGDNDEEKLESAAFYGSLRLVKHFVQKGTRITAGVVCHAIETDNRSRPVIEYLLNASLEAAHQGDRGVLESDLVQEAVQLLVDIEYTDKASGGVDFTYDIVFLRLIIPFVGRVYFADNKNKELIARLCENGNTELMEVILENTDLDQPHLADMFDYAFRFNLDVPRLLLRFGLDIKNYVHHGLPLFSRALNTYGGIRTLINKERNKFQFMVENGADVTVDNQNYFNVAITRGYREIVQAMLERGARANGHNDDGKALASACQSGHVDIMEMLIKKGADPTANDNIAILAASRSKTSGPIHNILRFPGVDVRARNNAPLIAAVAYNDEDTNARLLMERGADANARDGLPLMIACKRRMLSFVTALLGYGAKATEMALLASFYSWQPRNFEFLHRHIDDRIITELRGDLVLNSYVQQGETQPLENAKHIVGLLLRAGAQPTWFLAKEFALSAGFEDATTLFP